LHNPNQLRFAQCVFPSGVFDGTGDGSTHISPNHSDEVQECVVRLGVIDVGAGGGEVIGCD
jgi:hypothetical protein